MERVPKKVCLDISDWFNLKILTSNFIDSGYKRRSISNDSEIHLANVKKDKSSTMIAITNNCDGFLQNYASANSGDSSGESKGKEGLSMEKRQVDSSSFGQPNRPSHVRFNSLADISNKYNTQNKLKFKNGKIAENQYSHMRTPLNKTGEVAQMGNNSAPFFHPNLVKSQSAYHQHSDEYKDSSDGFGMMNYSYDGLQGNQGLENKENINLLECHDTVEDKLGDVSPLTSMMFANRICKPPKMTLNKLSTIVGIDKTKDVANQGEAPSGERFKCNCKKSRCLKLYCECFSSGLGCSKDCNCLDCSNVPGNFEREEAIRQTKERNPNAFKPKILFKGGPNEPVNPDVVDGRHTKGCNCKKSHCLKKY
jgi:hypothetical protein